MCKWNNRYVSLAQNISTWSKDPSKQIGAIAISDSSKVLATGYNGFPKGISDTPERLSDRPTKYKYMVHAEMNLIYNATYNGVSLDGSTVYVYGLPVCSECAKGLIQVGVKKVIMKIDTEIPEKWKESFEFTTQLFKEANIEWELYD